MKARYVHVQGQIKSREGGGSIAGVLVQGTVDVEMRIHQHFELHQHHFRCPDHHNVAVHGDASVRRTFKCRGIGLFHPKIYGAPGKIANWSCRP